MEIFLQQTLSGLVSGALYGSLAIALVLIMRTTGVVNFAQGEMAMFSAYVAWFFKTSWGFGWAPAILLTLLISVILGMTIQYLLIRPVQGSDELTLVIITIGLLIAVNALAGVLWTNRLQTMPPLLEGTLSIGNIRIQAQSVLILGVTLLAIYLLHLFLAKTRIGLALRAVATNPRSSVHIGLNVGLLMTFGWGLASGIGAISGVLAAPVLFLSPTMMSTVLIYALVGMVLGGASSLGGAFTGGLIVGISENLAGHYLLDGGIKIVIPLILLFAVLMVKPSGLFGSEEVRRA